jgi:uncharacterized protein YjbI with pentapeptide repeats
VSNVSNAGSESQKLNWSEILKLHKSYLESRPGGQRAVLIDRDLSGLTLTDQDFSHADVSGSSFYGSRLRGCRFNSATAFGCDFRHADLENASMLRTDLRGCTFEGASLVGADLFEADLREGGQVTRDRKGEFHNRGTGQLPATPFSGANLTNASLSGVFGVKTDFSNAIMRGCRLTRARVRGANFADCDLDGADFGQADTRDACFRGAVLVGANFDFADLAGSDMEDSLSDKPQGRLLTQQSESLQELLRRHLEFINTMGAAGQLLDISGFDLRMSGGSWVKACLSMAKASSAVFYKLDLTEAALQMAKCDGADFRNCRLDKADLRGISLKGARLNNASMRKVDLQPMQMGRGIRVAANLSNARLRNADLSGANLSGTSLVDADLSFADLSNATLTDADFSGARLDGCILSEAQLAVAKNAEASPKP